MKDEELYRPENNEDHRDGLKGVKKIKQEAQRHRL